MRQAQIAVVLSRLAPTAVGDWRAVEVAQREIIFLAGDGGADAVRGVQEGEEGGGVEGVVEGEGPWDGVQGEEGLVEEGREGVRDGVPEEVGFERFVRAEVEVAG